ncbi:replication initiation protein [Erysipelothrix inopinata]|uniref:Replication initiation protein n=1 Tax=Erysipelothrix inopinata TaxID=225084 RepID=A0A7G9S0Z6_9FIRM|nr:replication initiation protein [Erysipelothrix inopinata]QNN61521.1 replication initiation protein [Erysipelothrix inopinata]
MGIRDNNDIVSIRFNDLIMPYLVDLKSNFTQYHITEIENLNSNYSLILFKWIMMKFNQGQLHPEIPMDELREITDTKEEYQTRFSDFDKYVLKTATPSQC